MVAIGDAAGVLKGLASDRLEKRIHPLDSPDSHVYFIAGIICRLRYTAGLNARYEFKFIVKSIACYFLITVHTAKLSDSIISFLKTVLYSQPRTSSPLLPGRN
jgi:hypothetical protein